MQPARKSDSQPALPEKVWIAPQLRRLGKLTDEELELVKASEDPSSAFAKIYRKRTAAGHFVG